MNTHLQIWQRADLRGQECEGIAVQLQGAKAAQLGDLEGHGSDAVPRQDELLELHALAQCLRGDLLQVAGIQLEVGIVQQADLCACECVGCRE